MKRRWPVILAALVGGLMMLALGLFIGRYVWCGC